MIRVVLADDHVDVRSALQSLLESEGDILVVAQAEDGLDALAVVEALEPDVLLIDVRMPRLDGIEATRRVAASGVRTRVIVLTSFDIDEYVFGALEAGASGFLTKNAPPDDLRRAIRAADRGDGLIDPAVTLRVIKRFSHPARADALELLSPREREVACLLAEGLSNREVSDRLHLSVWTVKSHVASVLHKLGVRDRAGAVVAVLSTTRGARRV